MQLLNYLIPVVLEHFHFEVSSFHLESQSSLDVDYVLIEIPPPDYDFLNANEAFEKRLENFQSLLFHQIMRYNRHNGEIPSNFVSLNLIERLAIPESSLLPMFEQTNS